MTMQPSMVDSVNRYYAEKREKADQFKRAICDVCDTTVVIVGDEPARHLDCEGKATKRELDAGLSNVRAYRCSDCGWNGRISGVWAVSPRVAHLLTTGEVRV